MKKLLFIAALSLTMACGQAPATQENTEATPAYYGEKISADSAVSMADLKNMMNGQTEMQVKLTGPVAAVCKKKGCWMDLGTKDGDIIRVTFKDYGFFMPMDCAGKTATVRGVAKVVETSVEELQEYARDAGKSKDEVAAITQPEKELVFEADGVILQ